MLPKARDLGSKSKDSLHKSHCSQTTTATYSKTLCGGPQEFCRCRPFFSGKIRTKLDFSASIVTQNFPTQIFDWFMETPFIPSKLNELIIAKSNSIGEFSCDRQHSHVSLPLARLVARRTTNQAYIKPT